MTSSSASARSSSAATTTWRARACTHTTRCSTLASACCSGATTRLGTRYCRCWRNCVRSSHSPGSRARARTCCCAPPPSWRSTCCAALASCATRTCCSRTSLLSSCYRSCRSLSKPEDARLAVQSKASQ
nr:MAG: hypothetical protein [Molluscum contagiosum virus]